MKKALFYGGSFLILFSSCSDTPDRLGRLDLVKWRQDRGGCNGLRSMLVPDLKAVQQDLKGRSSNEIGQLLGRPDINQIADRAQKFYIYFLEKGPHCEDTRLKSNAPTVAIRMGAIGLATEVTFQNGLP
ncbi:hypothetical protein GCM10023189_02110 [Nibrella saemangeumensis]|uniref:Lipoprotein n=1 Tax=Nibrella saemangeumensis TaxID=1084526 RepID=A0ABP8M957_9BACT